MARKRNPYIVSPLNYRVFQDLKALKTDLNMNLKKAVKKLMIDCFQVLMTVKGIQHCRCHKLVPVLATASVGIVGDFANCGIFLSY
jgi:hypothetical protein